MVMMGEVVPVMGVPVMPVMARPPSAVEWQIVEIVVALPVIANPMRGDKPITILPTAGLVSVIAALAPLAAPSILPPVLVVAIDRAAVAEITTTIATANIPAICVAEPSAPIAIARAILVISPGTSGSITVPIAKASGPSSVALVL